MVFESILTASSKHRRFFCLAPTILLLSTDDSFAEHREYLNHSINFIVRGCHIFVERRQNLRNIIFPASLKRYGEILPRGNACARRWLPWNEINTRTTLSVSPSWENRSNTCNDMLAKLVLYQKYLYQPILFDEGELG